MTTAQDFIAVLQREIGVGESPSWSNRVPYWDEIGMSNFQGQPWCGAFITAIARRVGIGDQINYVYCPTGRNTFIQRGKLSDVPIIGSPCFFEWEHDNLVDHTGIVVAINGDGTVSTIEGNTHTAGQGNDQVEPRVRSLSLIRGFGVIDWPDTAPPAPAPTPPPAPEPPAPPGHTPGTGWFRANHPTITHASGAAAAEMQSLLGILSDGVWGRITQQAVISFQRSHGLGVDGSCGPLTWSSLHPVLRKGSIGQVVAEVQREVGCAPDGEFGGITDAQTRDFQRTHGLEIDGVVGPATYRAMMGV
jgi:peptidoglycan hydrolase-like protein with peptidoglycan-binding domain